MTPGHFGRFILNQIVTRRHQLDYRNGDNLENVFWVGHQVIVAVHFVTSQKPIMLPRHCLRMSYSSKIDLSMTHQYPVHNTISRPCIFNLQNSTPPNIEINVRNLMP